MATAQSNSEKVKEYHDDPEDIHSSQSSSPNSSPAASSASPASSSEDEGEKLPKLTEDNKPRCSKKLKKQRLATKTPLESIHESDSFGEPYHVPQSSSFTCFGVKSYLHEFYDQDKSHHIENFEYFSKKRLQNKRIRAIWKFSYWVGGAIILTGLIFLILGYTAEERTVFVGSMNNIEIVDRDAASYNDYLQAIRIVGLLGFCCGGLILACSFFLPSFFCYKQCIYKDDMFDMKSEKPLEVTRNYNQLDAVRSQMEYKTVQPQTLRN